VGFNGGVAVVAATIIPTAKRFEKVFLRLLAAVGEPWRPAKRGRKPKRSPKDYVLALFARSKHGLTYRAAEELLGILKTCLR